MTGLPQSECSLGALPKGASGIVTSIRSIAGARDDALERRLLEFGFCGGERFEILAETRPGRDPFVVRIGSTTLALRRREAAVILVRLDGAQPGGAPHAGSARRTASTDNSA
jgi:ferrous iron transport protein A